jgi:pimeloyl-ACP methyl ester carboxylesterase
VVASAGRGVVTLVLVHGGTVTSTMWDGVSAHLAAPSLAVDLPGRRYKPADLATVTRADWIRSVCRDVESAGLDDIVLVGHSSAGFVIPGVATSLGGRVRGLVFVSANVPAQGRTPAEYMREDLRALAADSLAFVLAKTKGRTLGGLRPGEPPIETGLEIVENKPRFGLEAPGPLFEPFDWDGFPAHLPRTYVRCQRDRVITPDMAATMVANMGGATVVDIDAGHNVADSDPAALAAILDTCALVDPVDAPLLPDID